MSYPFDPTGRALQNKVIGESKAIALAPGRFYLFVFVDGGPFFADSVSIKFTNQAGESRVLSQAEWRPGFYFSDASIRFNRPVFAAIELVDVTLVGTLTYNYQNVGGTYVPAQSVTNTLNTLTTQDPQYTKWEEICAANSITLNAVPVVDHPYSRINVDEVKRLADQLEEAGLAIQLRASLLQQPGEAAFIPTPAEIGLGHVGNYRMATETEATAGDRADLYMSPLSTSAAVTGLVNTALGLLGYQLPIAYTAGLNVDATNKTYSFRDAVYAPKASAVPFVTNGAFEASKFRLIRSTAPRKWNVWKRTVSGTETTNFTGAKIFQTNLDFTCYMSTKLIVNNVMEIDVGMDYHLDGNVLHVDHPLETGDVLELYYREFVTDAPSSLNYYKTFQITSGVQSFTLPGMDNVQPEELRVILNDFIVLSRDTDYTIINGMLNIIYPVKLGDVIEVEDINSAPVHGRKVLRSILSASRQA